MDRTEKLRVAANNFSILLEDYKWRDQDGSKMLEWLTPLFDEIKAGRVTLPKRYEYRMALGKDSPFYDPYGPFSRAEAYFACALEDWTSQPWYKQ